MCRRLIETLKREGRNLDEFGTNSGLWEIDLENMLHVMYIDEYTCDYIRKGSCALSIWVKCLRHLFLLWSLKRQITQEIRKQLTGILSSLLPHYLILLNTTINYTLV